MRYLVTGCAGFIGSTLTDSLLADGHEVVGVDCFSTYYDPAFKQRNIAGAREHASFALHELDLAGDDLPGSALDVDGVFHLAAQAGVRASWGREFETYTGANVLATQRVLEAAANAGTPPSVVYASSSSIYGNAMARPTREDALPSPVSPYGVTKLAAEHLCETYAHNFGLRTVSLRFFTVFGPRQRPDMAFHKFTRAALQGTQITIFGDGNQTRDFTFVDDIVAANRAAMDSADARGAYNLGGGTTVTVRETLAMLEDIVGKPLDVTYGDAQLGDVLHTSADTSRAERDLGFAPKVDLRTGLEREVAWMRELLAAGVVS